MSSQNSLIFKVKGSKSYTNRALILAGLSSGKTILKNMLQSEDTVYMIKALKSLGVSIRRVSKDSLIINGRAGKFKKPKNPIFTGNSGTCMRFISALLAVQNFSSIITGNKRMQSRPIKDLVDALRKLGAEIIYLKKQGFPPLKIKGPLLGGSCGIKGSVSSQFISALLMAAAYALSNVTLAVTGKILSKPYIDMTIFMMKKFGINVRRREYREFFVPMEHPAKEHPVLHREHRVFRVIVEPDASSASYWWGIAALNGIKICVSDINLNSKQADIKFLTMLKKMGCRVISEKNCICAEGPALAGRLASACRPSSAGGPSSAGRPGKLKPLGKVNLSDMPDSALTLAVVSAFAKGRSELRGLSNLKFKECDRLEAVKKGLSRIGCKVKKLDDGWIIYGNPEKLHAGEIQTYNDHRIAMSFAAAKSMIPNIRIKNPICVQKTYPEFWKDFKKFVKQKNIVLTGLRGSGKTRLGEILAKKLHRKFYDLDSIIEKEEKQSIPEIVRKKGWNYFRKLERRLVKKFHGISNSVISCGGGTLIFKENMEILRKNSFIIFLKAPLGLLRFRLLYGKKRPPLMKVRNAADELGQVWEKRKNIYKKIADMVFEIRNIDKQKQAKNLLREIRSYEKTI